MSPRESRPAGNRAAETSTTPIIRSEPIVTRSAVETLLSTLEEGTRAPRWYTHPTNEVQFAASLLAHCPDVTAVYDADEVLVHYLGIRLRGAV